MLRILIVVTSLAISTGCATASTITFATQGDKATLGNTKQPDYKTINHAYVAVGDKLIACVTSKGSGNYGMSSDDYTLKLPLVAFARSAVDAKVSDEKVLSSGFPILEGSVVEERCKDPVTDKLRDVRIVNLSGKHDVSALRDRFGEQESLFLIRDTAAVTDTEQYRLIGDYVFVYVGPGPAKGYFPFRVAAVERREFPPLHLLIFLPFAVVADIITSPIQLWFWLQNEDRENSP